MKLNQPFRRRAPQLAAVGCLAFAVQVACSDAPTQSGNVPIFPTAGTSAGGTPANTAGTPAASGSFSTSGSFGTAGTTDVGGTGGTTGGTATAGTATTAGTGGTTVVVPPTPYCQGKTLSTLPYTVETNYFPSGWSVGPPDISVPADLVYDACTSRVTGAVGNCTKWRYTPQAVPAPVWVIWAVPPLAPAATSHACLATGATAIAFCARGEKGGEKIQTGGAGVNEAEITLTDEWKTFTVPLTGVNYNTDENGVPTGFVWKVVPAAVPAITEFFIDKIQIVKDAPGADYCGDGGDGGGGEGGAGGAGGAGG